LTIRSYGKPRTKATDGEQGWTKIPDAVLCRGDISATAKLVYAAILDEAGPDGVARKYVGIRHIARKVGVQATTVHRCLMVLECAKLIERRPGKTGQRTTYHLQKSARKMRTVPEPQSAHKMRALSDGPQKPKRTQNAYGSARKMRTQPDPGQTHNFPTGSARQKLGRAVCNVTEFEPVTRADHSRIGRVVNDLLAKGATPHEIRTRADRYRRAWPTCELTPEALAKHWQRFATDAPSTRHPGRVEASKGKYDHLTQAG
jgi:DNA-binding MarR family transcriptional regulator